MVCGRHAAALNGDVSDMAFIAMSHSVERGLIEQGARPDRVLRVMPAAPNEPVEPARGAAVLLPADRHDTSAEAVGLHLTSHVRLWNAVSELLRAGPPDNLAARVDRSFDAAQQRLGVRIDSDEVRGGLIERIRMRLVPELFRQAAYGALATAGVAFHVMGRGWGRAPFEPIEYNSRLAAAPEDTVADSSHRRETPLPGDELSAALRDFGAVVFLEASDDLVWHVMECVAAGRVVFVPAVSIDRWREGGFDALGAMQHVVVFDSIAALTNALAGFVREADAHLARAAKAAEHVRRHHSWAYRIAESLKFLDTMAEAAP